MIKVAIMGAGILGGIFTGDVPLAMIFGFVLMLGLLADSATVPSLQSLAASGSQSREPILKLPGMLEKERQAAREIAEE